jgi:hypothetical protein
MITFDEWRGEEYLTELNKQPWFTQLNLRCPELARLFARLCHDFANGNELRVEGVPTGAQLLFDAIRDQYRQLVPEKQRLLTTAIGETRDGCARHQEFVHQLRELESAFDADRVHDTFIDPQTTAMQAIAAALNDIVPEAGTIASSLAQIEPRTTAMEEIAAALKGIVPDAGKIASSLTQTLAKQQGVQERQTEVLHNVVTILDGITARNSSLPPPPNPASRRPNT